MNAFLNFNFDYIVWDVVIPAKGTGQNMLLWFLHWLFTCNPSLSMLFRLLKDAKASAIS